MTTTEQALICTAVSDPHEWGSDDQTPAISPVAPEFVPSQYCTPNVTAIYGRIRHDHDYSRVPILLDALMDAGADDETMQTVLMLWACAEPMNDEPRLLFADSVGGERAEFIRLPVEINRLFAITEKWARTPSDELGGTREDGAAAGEALAEAQRLQYRRDDLLHKHGAEWSGVRPGANVVRWNGLYDNHAHRPNSRAIISWKWHRGFIDSITTDWATWLRHHEALFWHPDQRVPCPGYDVPVTRNGADGVMHERCWTITRDRKWWRKCKGGCKGKGAIKQPFTREVECPACRGDGKDATDVWNMARTKLGRNCPQPCSGTGRITVSLADTVQPLTKLRLTTWPCHAGEIAAHTEAFYATIGGDQLSPTSAGNMRFVRAKCRTCDGVGAEMRLQRIGYVPCPTCHGTPPNLWTCEAWPGLEVVMPEAAPVLTFPWLDLPSDFVGAPRP